MKLFLLCEQNIILHILQVLPCHRAAMAGLGWQHWDISAVPYSLLPICLCCCNPMERCGLRGTSSYQQLWLMSCEDAHQNSITLEFSSCILSPCKEPSPSTGPPSVKAKCPHVRQLCCCSAPAPSPRRTWVCLQQDEARLPRVLLTPKAQHDT